MTTTEIKILYTFSNVIPRLPTIDKERLLAFGQGLSFKLDLEREQQIEAGMEGITSKATQLKALSIVDDVQGELDKIKEEMAAQEQSILENMMFQDPARVQEAGV